MSGPDAPEAPGRLGEPIPAPQLLRYLSGLEAWLAHRRAELDRLDQAAQASPASESYTDDVLLALTMWQAIRTRTDELVKVWDSGRADAVDREKMSQLVNGVLDQAKADGSWAASYDRWLGDLGPAPAPPVSVYGRVDSP